MGKRFRLTKTDVFLLGLTLLFAAAVALTGWLTPRQARGDYEIDAVEPSERTVQPQRLNINTATADQLDSLPGIGPVLAQRIVDWRVENGPFADVEQLTQVEGIGQATLDSIRDIITTEETEE